MEKQEIHWMFFIGIVGGTLGTTFGVILARWVVKILGLDI